MDNEELDGVKFSEFPSQTPGNSDEVVGLHSGDNARFSIANIVAAVRNGLTNIFVPLTRTINGKGLSTDITLDSSDIDYDNTASGLTATDVQEAIDELAQGGGGGSAADITYDPTTSGASATNVQDALDEAFGDLDDKQASITASGILKGDGQGGVTAATAGTDYQAPLTAGTDYATPTQLKGKANQAQLAYVETGTTASQNYTAGQYISLNGLLYTADTAIANGATFYTSGGNKNLTECVGGGFNNLFSVLGNIRIKIVSIHNNKQSSTLNGAHGIDTDVNTIVFCARYPSSNQKWMMDQCTVTYYTQDVTITKPAASYGGNNDIYYVLVAYLPTSLL